MGNDLTTIVNDANDVELISGSEELSSTQQFVLNLVKYAVGTFGLSVIAYAISKKANFSITRDQSGAVSVSVTAANQQEQVKQTS